MATTKIATALGLASVAIGLAVAVYTAQEPTRKLDVFCSGPDPYIELNTPLYTLLYDVENKGPIHIEYTVDRSELKPVGATRTGSFWYPACREDLPPLEAFRNGYDRGHLLADRLSDSSPHRDWAWFMGAVSPMHYRLNRGPFRALEDAIYKEASVRDVSVKITIVYSKPVVPDEFIVEVSGLGMFVFPNRDPGERKMEDFRCQK